MHDVGMPDQLLLANNIITVIAIGTHEHSEIVNLL